MQGYPNPKDYQDYSQMLPKYTYALGGTEAIRQLVEFVEGARQVLEELAKRSDGREAHKIG